MRNITSWELNLVPILLLATLNSSCASQPRPYWKPLEVTGLRIDKSCYCRFIRCMRVRDHFWQPWKQVCEYYPFEDKVKIKELADKDMVLKVRVKP